MNDILLKYVQEVVSILEETADISEYELAATEEKDLWGKGYAAGSLAHCKEAVFLLRLAIANSAQLPDKTES
jgi:hypothetical protein